MAWNYLWNKKKSKRQAKGEYIFHDRKKQDKTEKKKNQTIPCIREHDGHRTAWVPSQGSKK